MSPELKEKILEYNKALAERSEKASDMDIIVASLAKLPRGQLKKILTDDLISILEKYGVTLN